MKALAFPLHSRDFCLPDEELAPTEMGEQRSGMAATVVKGKVYIMGGHNGDTPLKLTEVFVPGEHLDSRGTWRRLPPMQARRTHCSASTLGDMVYVIGGSADGRTLNTFEVFDPARGEWAVWFTKPPMQTKRTMHASAVADGRLFVCGGSEGIRDLAILEEFDLTTGTWIFRDKMASARSYFAMAATGSNLYAIGGQDRRQEETPRAHCMVERFDLYSERWFEAAPLLQGRVGACAATLTCADDLEYIFVCGGSNGEDVLASMDRFDPRANVWVETPPMNVARVGHAVAVVDNRLYVFGGFDGKEPLDTFECFDPKLNRWGPALKIGFAHVEEDEPLHLDLP